MVLLLDLVTCLFEKSRRLSSQQQVLTQNALVNKKRIKREKARKMILSRVPHVPLLLLSIILLVNSVHGNYNYYYQQQQNLPTQQQVNNQGNQYYPQQPLQHQAPQGSQTPGMGIPGSPIIPGQQPQIPQQGLPGHQPVNGMMTQFGAVETIDQNILTSNNLECSRCGNSRLIGCMKRKCYYRCYRRCHDGNGTSWDEAIRFTLAGTR